MYYVYIIVPTSYNHNPRRTRLAGFVILNPNHRPGVTGSSTCMTWSHVPRPIPSKWDHRPIFVRIMVHNSRFASRGGILPSYHTFSKCCSSSVDPVPRPNRPIFLVTMPWPQLSWSRVVEFLCGPPRFTWIRAAVTLIRRWKEPPPSPSNSSSLLSLAEPCLASPQSAHVSPPGFAAKPCRALHRSAAEPYLRSTPPSPCAAEPHLRSVLPSAATWVCRRPKLESDGDREGVRKKSVDSP